MHFCLAVFRNRFHDPLSVHWNAHEDSRVIVATGVTIAHCAIHTNSLVVFLVNWEQGGSAVPIAALSTILTLQEKKRIGSNPY